MEAVLPILAVSSDAHVFRARDSAVTKMLKTHDVAKVLSEWRELLDRRLVEVAEHSGTESKSLNAAATYVLQGHGKRLRALLALSICCDLTECSSDKLYAMHPAIALEMLHAASLVHDDLPALDNDDMRRGRPSCHRQFNEATAILTGDYLIGRSFLVVNGAALTPLQKLGVLAHLAQAWSDLCMGQQVDIDKPTDLAEVHRLMELKTGALFAAAAACGAICADTDDAATARFYTWGMKLGVLFQKLDDLADGDGIQGIPFEREKEIQDLYGQISALSGRAMPLTAGVFRALVGQEVG